MAQGKKTGGRMAGTPNRLTSDLKSRIAALVDQQFDTIVSDLNQLEPKERLTIYLKFVEYVLPKQREVKGEGLQRITLVDDLDHPFPYTLTPEDVKAFNENFNAKY
jgi:hypothetical protein